MSLKSPALRRQGSEASSYGLLGSPKRKKAYFSRIICAVLTESCTYRILSRGSSIHYNLHLQGAPDFLHTFLLQESLYTNPRKICNTAERAGMSCQNDPTL